MAMEPITLFARIADPVAVARRLRELVPGVQLDGLDSTWRKAVILFGTDKAPQTLTLPHDPDYYAEPNWSSQMNGMREYFSRFPDTDRKQFAMMVTTSLHFSLGTMFDPDIDSENDPRFDILLEIARILDGVLFTPTSLQDASGRVLFGAGGEIEEDSNAVWPRVIAEVPLPELLEATADNTSQPKPPDEEDEDTNAPTPDRVVRRALALTSVTVRAILEQDATRCGNSAGGLFSTIWRFFQPHLIDRTKIRKTYHSLLDWIGELGIREEFEPDEFEVIQRPPGHLDLRSQINSTWRLEGLSVLAWALGRFDIPAHDQLVEFHSLWHSLGYPDVKATRVLLAKPVLRPRAEIKAIRNRMFGLHWRLRNFGIHPETIDFAKYAKSCWFGPLDIRDGSVELLG